jgi:uncharacterized protein
MDLLTSRSSPGMNLNSDKYFLMIKDIIINNFGDDVRIILFGSRAKAANQNASDYDISIISEKNDKLIRMSRVKEELENSNIPFKVDLVDFNSVPEIFQKSIKQNGIEWKN